ncbi:MAG: MFS transporter [Bacteroidetes bacterium]|nr:MFS transporter [Bacteroidota bacterium]
MKQSELYHSPFNLPVIAAGLGFFVDAFDLFLFSIYRIQSLSELGLSGVLLKAEGERLLAIQMLGMMIGGVLTGIIGDKKGRVAVLFGSILLYSLANIANAFVHDVDTYAFIRFLAGVGLAGELGAGITLVSESMTVERRGYGTILVATMGALGAVFAGLAGDLMPWRDAFLAAGIAGLLLLLLRMKSLESSMFKMTSKNQTIGRGSFFYLFSNPKRSARYFACILMGVPIWFSVGILITLSPELAKESGVDGWALTKAFTLFQLGITSGDLSSGIFSQVFKSRKKVILAYMSIAVLATVFYFYFFHNGIGSYVLCFLMGLGCGYLSVFVTTTAEQFGTNLRVLVSATVTNFMRGSVTLLIPFHLWLENSMGTTLTLSLIITGVVVWSLAILSTLLLSETYGKDLNYQE